MSERRIQLKSLIRKLPKLLDHGKAPEIELDHQSDETPPEQIRAKAERWANSPGLQPPTKR